jgi:hypothetical protein
MISRGLKTGVSKIMTIYGNKFYKKRLCIFILLIQSSITPLFSQLAFLPFKDHSGFKSKWELGIEIPNFLRVFIKEKFDIQTLSPRIADNYLKNKGLSLEEYYSLDAWKDLAEKYKFRYLITGDVVEFRISKFLAGFPLVAGYESFSCAQMVSFKLYDVYNEKLLLQGDLNNSLSDRGLGITLGGKPTERNKEYNTIDDIKFGSEDFKKTMFGESMFKISQEFSMQLENYIPIFKPDFKWEYKSSDDDSVLMRKEFITGRILFFDKEKAFINLGSSDEITKGEKLLVLYPTPDLSNIDKKNDKVAGFLEVLEVRGQHISICKIIDGNDKIKEKFIIQKLIIK